MPADDQKGWPMAEESKIEWTDATFSSWIGCTKVSEACNFCYAEEQNNFRKWNGGVWGPGTKRKVMSDHYWKQPLIWEQKAKLTGKTVKVFCSSLADVFDSESPPGQRERLFELIKATPHLFWLLLTKRPHLISRMLPPDWGPDGYPNVALGTTIEMQKYARIRLDYLFANRAPVYFVSAEPLLEEIDLTRVDLRGPGSTGPVVYGNYLSGRKTGLLSLPGRVSWLICGGESGGSARPFDVAWARSLRHQCRVSRSAFFMKQLGAKPVEAGVAFRAGRKGDRLEDLPADLRIREFPKEFRA